MVRVTLLGTGVPTPNPERMGSCVVVKMIGIPFWGSAIETPRTLPVTACQPPFGSCKQLAGGADSPRKPISAKTVVDKGRYF
ncbi:MAG: hypothetical protein ACE10C_09885, partial [Candidatus Binatia bacterium]